MSSKPQMHKQWLTIKVLELYSQGNSYRQIADIMQVTVHRVRSVLQGINAENKEHMYDYINNNAGLRFAASLALTDSILRKSMELSEKEKDPRVILQALELAHEMNLVKNQLLVDSQRIANAIKRQSLKLMEAA